MRYEWNESTGGTNHSIEVGNDGAGPWLLAGHNYVDWGEKSLSVNLPTDPAEVAKLLAAILEATGCKLSKPIFAEFADEGLRGMMVIQK